MLCFLALYSVSKIVNLQVYDISTFMDEHPGGDNVLLAVTGT